jgi:hypothetical protein
LGPALELFIDLTEETEGLLPYRDLLKAHNGVSHRRFPIRDVSTPHSREVTTAILDTIDAEIAKDGLVYVHCWGGVGRTGLIIGCWLARHCGDGSTALIRLREIWQQCGKSAKTPVPGDKSTRALHHRLAGITIIFVQQGRPAPTSSAASSRTHRAHAGAPKSTIPYPNTAR